MNFDPLQDHPKWNRGTRRITAWPGYAWRYMAWRWRSTWRDRLRAADPRTVSRLRAELSRLWHAACHPFHKIAAATDEDDTVLAIWCKTCQHVFLDRVAPPMTVQGVIEKAARFDARQKGMRK